MARSPRTLPPGLPDCLKKRRLLNDKGLTPEVCREYGEKFLALEWWEDALEFFLKGRYSPGLEQLKAFSIDNGDAYLLARTGKDHAPEVWGRLGEQALALGKLQFARRAFEMAGDSDRSAAVAELLEGQNPTTLTH
jgi:hypothetical protein